MWISEGFPFECTAEKIVCQSGHNVDILNGTRGTIEYLILSEFDGKPLTAKGTKGFTKDAKGILKTLED